MSPRYSIGIDLGTTNSVLAYTSLEVDAPMIKVLEIPQITGPHQTEALSSLPSFAYLPTETEQVEGGLSKYSDLCIGSYARRISAEQPERTVAAAKSWLCHREVDRQARILPWQAPDELSKISPVQASAYFLKHLAAAWNEAFPDCPLSEQSVVLTVPASFDPVARELTLQAAREAGLPENLILLEEPQAAVYHWIHSVGEKWRTHLEPSERILVCDCGGGTTDLTLLQVDQIDGELVLQRIAVGNHLLIGGDNMDLALAHFAAGKFTERGVKLNAWQAIGLWHACRNAKEKLFALQGMESFPVSVLGRGSRVIGGTVSLELKREDIEAVLLDGFFPHCAIDDRPGLSFETGFQELGLPYESDTAVTKHVAAFLTDHRITDGLGRLPKHLLFNGGVFKAVPMRRRLMETLQSWSTESDSIEMLGGVEDLDTAVASGASYYGWSKINGGVRIRGGTAAGYYVGIESSGPAIPGIPRPLQALCVAPQGMEEGTEAAIPDRRFGVTIGRPAKFRFFSSHVRPTDEIGKLLKEWDEGELIESNALELTLEDLPAEANSPAPGSDSAVMRAGGNVVPVRFESRITELGMFELWCVGLRDDQRWKLSFNVRSNLQ
jgi:hypothetical protein